MSVRRPVCCVEQSPAVAGASARGWSAGLVVVIAVVTVRARDVVAGALALAVTACPAAPARRRAEEAGFA